MSGTLRKLGAPSTRLWQTNAFSPPLLSSNLEASTESYVLGQRKLLKVKEEVGLKDRRGRENLALAAEDDCFGLVRHGNAVGGCEAGDGRESLHASLLKLLLEGAEDFRQRGCQPVCFVVILSTKQGYLPGRFLTNVSKLSRFSKVSGMVSSR